ncbi:Aste57867_23954 [Aphanomyces stellatus]|uniref:Aste57867_23954 protein n=1 Tax=Aphanomyces stellatus TaxID=120398 RepID=A0A485LP68_9STRA|nr:hypothetical protein As57867_023881 [Aphanomyces stellatus]VFU00597.1 Aste57867_23954 [Aphanomyces stellatus]
MLRRFLSTKGPQAVRRPASEARRAMEKTPEELQATTQTPAPEIPPQDPPPQSFGHFFLSNFIWGGGAMLGVLLGLSFFRSFMEEAPTGERKDKRHGAHLLTDAEQ